MCCSAISRCFSANSRSAHACARMPRQPSSICKSACAFVGPDLLRVIQSDVVRHPTDCAPHSSPPFPYSISPEQPPFNHSCGARADSALRAVSDNIRQRLLEWRVVKRSHIGAWRAQHAAFPVRIWLSLPRMSRGSPVKSAECIHIAAMLRLPVCLGTQDRHCDYCLLS